MALKWQASCLSLPSIGVMCTIMSAWQSVIVLEVRVSQNGLTLVAHSCVLGAVHLVMSSNQASRHPVQRK